MLKAEAPALWPPDVKSWLTGKNPDAQKDWWQGEKKTIEDEMNMHLSKLWELVKDGQAWSAAVHGVTVRHDLASKQQQQQ